MLGIGTGSLVVCCPHQYQVSCPLRTFKFAFYVGIVATLVTDGVRATCENTG